MVKKICDMVKKILRNGKENLRNGKENFPKLYALQIGVCWLYSDGNWRLEMPPRLQYCKFIHYGVLEVICFWHNLLAASDLVAKLSSVFVSSLVKI